MRLRTRKPGLLAIPALWIGLVAICCSGTAIAAVSSSKGQRISLAGTWSGHYSGAYTGTFTLHWRQSGSQLRGTIMLSRPRGKYGITGSVHGKAITFGAVGAGATYTGSVSGRSMSGTYRSGPGHGTWSAHKTSS